MFVDYSVLIAWILLTIGSSREAAQTLNLSLLNAFQLNPQRVPTGHSTFSSVQSLSRVRLFATPLTIACQDPLSMGFSRQESWSGFPCPPSGDLPDPGIEPMSGASPALADGFFATSTT